MDVKKELKEIIHWGQESDENKQKVISASCFMINFLTTSKEKISDEKIKEISGGYAPDEYYGNFWSDLEF
jgi:hypothetical protein